jgi:sec-independent protein translocase protein TatC
MTRLWKPSFKDSPQAISQHLYELRRRVFWYLATFGAAFVACYFYAEDIFLFLSNPLEVALQSRSSKLLFSMIYTDLAEAFLSYIKVSLFAAFIITFPVMEWHIWKFIVPALYKGEKKQVRIFLLSMPLLFIFGGCVAYFFVLPKAFEFFLSFEILKSPSFSLQLIPKIEEYSGLIMKIIFAFGVSFQFPLVLVLLSYMGILTGRTLARARRYVIVILFAAAAILTPPDVLSQVGLAVPLILFYELAILVIKFIELRRVDYQEVRKLKDD